MARVRSTKNSFSGGEISPQLLGRDDLRVFDTGARTLRNVFIDPTGGVSRRDGLRYMDMVFGPGRLVAFEFNTEQVYVLLFCDSLVQVFREGTRVASFGAPWTEAQIPQINWTQSADTLLVVHPDLPPKKITRSSDTVWDIADWSFAVNGSRIESPHSRFAASQVTLRASATTGSVVVTASQAVFTSQHMGVRLRIANKELQISSVQSATQVQAMVKETLSGTTATVDWTEESFSNARGWPVSVCFHQDRLVVGGSRDQPNRLWLSKSGDLFNFDLGEGLDDESIEFPLLSDQVNAIRHVFSGRHLQVFTSGAEWMVTGEPLTPTSIQLFRQTRVGSPVDRSIPLRDVDGATVFVPRIGPQLREFLFTDTQQAYQSNDLAVLAPHLVDTPVDMDFDEARRMLHVVMANGKLATLTVFRDEQVNGWTLQETDGDFLSVAVVGDETYVLLRRDAGITLELFDSSLFVDCGLAGQSDPPKQDWTGADQLEGRTVMAVADKAVVTDLVVTSGTIHLSQPASEVQLGLPYTHVIEPLPPQIQNLGSNQGLKLRPVSLTFRLWETGALVLDTGNGLSNVPFHPTDAIVLDVPQSPYSGDINVRTVGWREGGLAPLWRIEQNVPVSFTLLAVTSELSVNG